MKFESSSRSRPVMRTSFQGFSPVSGYGASPSDASAGQSIPDSRGIPFVIGRVNTIPGDKTQYYDNAGVLRQVSMLPLPSGAGVLAPDSGLSFADLILPQQLGVDLGNMTGRYVSNAISNASPTGTLSQAVTGFSSQLGANIGTGVKWALIGLVVYGIFLVESKRRA